MVYVRREKRRSLYCGGAGGGALRRSGVCAGAVGLKRKEGSSAGCVGCTRR